VNKIKSQSAPPPLRKSGYHSSINIPPKKSESVKVRKRWRTFSSFKQDFEINRRITCKAKRSKEKEGSGHFGRSS
jgi:hypothetical protein